MLAMLGIYMEATPQFLLAYLTLWYRSLSCKYSPPFALVFHMGLHRLIDSSGTVASLAADTFDSLLSLRTLYVSV